MNSIKSAVICAVLAGILGAVIWAAIGHYFHIRIHYVAIAIGALVGLAASMGAAGEADTNTGVLAAIIAVTSITFARYVVYKMEVENDIAQYIAQIDGHKATIDLARQLATEQEAAGKTLAWPAGMSVQTCVDSSDLPANIWAEAGTAWAKLSPDQQQSRISSLRSATSLEIKSGKGPVALPTFMQCLSFFDYLYAFIAAAAAFKLGGGFDT